MDVRKPTFCLVSDDSTSHQETLVVFSFGINECDLINTEISPALFCNNVKVFFVSEA